VAFFFFRDGAAFFGGALAFFATGFSAVCLGADFFFVAGFLATVTFSSFLADAFFLVAVVLTLVAGFLGGAFLTTGFFDSAESLYEAYGDVVVMNKVPVE